MKNNQVKLLEDLAKKIQSTKKDRAQIVATFISAKILTKHENFTTHYPNLKRVIGLAK